MVTSRRKLLICAKTADIPLPERPNLPTLTIGDRAAEVLLSSWVAEAEEVEASAEEALVEVASEAVEPVADFKSNY